MAQEGATLVVRQAVLEGVFDLLRGEVARQCQGFVLLCHLQACWGQRCQILHKSRVLDTTSRQMRLAMISTQLKYEVI